MELWEQAIAKHFLAVQTEGNRRVQCTIKTSLRLTSGELERSPTVSKMDTVQQEGPRIVNVVHCNSQLINMLAQGA